MPRIFGAVVLWRMIMPIRVDFSIRPGRRIAGCDITNPQARNTAPSAVRRGLSAPCGKGYMPRHDPA
jgi:hypothetical protein